MIETADFQLCLNIIFRIANENNCEPVDVADALSQSIAETDLYDLIDELDDMVKTSDVNAE